MPLYDYKAEVDAQASSPAAPAGQQQMAASASGDPAESQYLVEGGYVPDAQSWYTGANTEGTNNGWDSAWAAEFVDQQNAAAANGTLSSFFSQPNATGVVTWDHESENGQKFTFGDIYQGGQKVGNVFKQFDKDTANLMMADWLFTKEEKVDIFSDSDNLAKLETEVAGQREQNNIEIPRAITAREMDAKVDERSEAWQGEGDLQETGVTTAGAAGSAALAVGGAAALGFSWTGPGAIIAGGAGALIGGGAAWLNRDALIEQAARAYEITSMSTEENGGLAGVATGVQQWAGAAGSYISPFQNLNRGFADAQLGDTGDGTAEFYAVDKRTGESLAPTWMKVLDVGAALADAGLQFSNPIGVGLYTTQMTAYIGGEVSELALTGGETFNYASGTFDNIFTDEEGNFDASQAMAGIGKVGIDVVQLGMARGIASKVDATVARTAAPGATVTGVYGTGRFLQPFRSAAAKKALAEGGDDTIIAGFRVTTDAAGKVVSQRPALALLAPSEQLTALSARIVGRRMAAVNGGAYTADDFYRAAQALSIGERQVQTTLVNGFGEAYEEGIQAVLEPHSHQNAISAYDVFQQGAYGFAMGAGMGLGTGYRTPGLDAKLFAQARIAHYTATGGDMLTETEWNSLSDMEKRSRAAMGNMQLETVKAAYKKVSNDQSADTAARVVGASKLMDAVQSVLKQNLARATDRTDSASVIIPLEDTAFPSDAVTSSGLQLAQNHNNRMRGVGFQLEQLKGRMVELNKQLEQNPTDAELLADQADLQTQINQVTLMQAWGKALDTELDYRVPRMYAENATEATVQAEADALNDLLRKAFNRELTTIGGQTLTDEDKMALARVVTQITTRDPQDASRSYQALLPQVDTMLTLWKSDNVLGISQSILSAIRGDYDGDKVRDLNQLQLDDEAFISLRSGAQFIGAGEHVNVGVPKSEEFVIEYLAKAYSTGNVGLGAEATNVMTQVGAAIRSRYSGVIEDSVLDEVLQAFFTSLKAGEGDARKVLLDGLADRAGGQITEFARGNLSNEWLWVSRFVQTSLQRFQETYAAYTDAQGEPNTTNVTPNQQSTDVKERRALKAATDGATLSNDTAGESMFRKFQKLHYSLVNSASDTAIPSGERVTLEEMAMLYRTLGQGITKTQLDETHSKDDITARVYLQLQRLTLDAKRVNPELTDYQALAVVANIEVPSFTTNPDGTIKLGNKNTTLAQMLLRQSVDRDAREKDLILEGSPELKAKHYRLRTMSSPPRQGHTGSTTVNAEKTFVEVFGSQQLWTLLGEDAKIFGPHLTVEQFVRSYASLSDAGRNEMAIALKSDPAYGKRKKTHNLPYSEDEIVGGQITPYRSVVDSILAVGNARHADAKNKSDKAGEDFQEGHRKMRQALAEFAGLAPGKEDGLNVDLVRRMLENNPDRGAEVMALIPNAAANAVFEVRGGEIYMSNWVYDMFATNDSKEAEMIYYRNLLLAQWNALGANSWLSETESEEGGSTRQFSKLKRRMHRIMWQLAANNDGGLLLQKFLTELEGATSVENFFDWINSTPGILGNQAPLTAWVDDVAEFDMDKAQGGWTTELQGAELREAMSTLRKGSEKLVKDIVEERLIVNEDASVLRAIERHAAVLAGDTSVKPKEGDRALYEQMAKVIEEAGERVVGLGPSAMIYQTVAAARGFYPQAHAKGKNPDHLDAAAAIDAQRDAYDYVTNYERVMASLTSQNLDAIGGSLDMVAKDGGRAMDDHGRVVEWGKPTVLEMVALLKNPEQRAMARAILYPQVLERDFDGVIRPKLLSGKSLKAFFSGSGYKDLFPSGDTLNNDQAFRYLAEIEGLARKEGGHFSVQRAANDIVIARTSAADHVLSTAEIERITIQVYRDIAKILQAAGSVPGALQGTDPLEEIVKTAKAARRDQVTATQLNLTAEGLNLKDLALEDLIQENKNELQARKTQLVQNAAEVTDPGEIDILQREIDALDADAARFEEKVRLLSQDDFVGSVINMFTIPPNPVEGAGVKSNLIKYVTTHLSVMETASENKILVNKITRQLSDPAYAGQVYLTDKEWKALSNLVTALYIDEVISVQAPNIAVPPFPDVDSTAASNRRYYDPSFGYLIDPLLSQDSPLVAAARAMHARAGRIDTVANDSEIYTLLNNTLYKDFQYGAWTGDIPRASIEANELLDSASAAPAISMAGNSPKRQAAISAATKRTFGVPPDALLTTTNLLWNDLVGENLYDEVVMQHPTGEVRRPLAQLNNRFARSVLLNYVDAQGNPQQHDLLAEDRNLGRLFRSDKTAVASGLQEIHLSRIRDAAIRVMAKHGGSPVGTSVDISFFHPDMQPSTGYANNLFFEGTSFKYDADVFRSLNETLFFAEGAINPEMQGAALDSRKLGTPGLEVVELPTSAEREAIEQGWLVDFSEMLRVKTRLLMSKQLGAGGKLDPEFYNATYKNMKLRHYVEGEVDGDPVRWTAEQVVEFQLANPGQPLPINNPRLWVPSDDVLRSMLGEQGTQGVARLLNTGLEIDLAAIPEFLGVTEKMMDLFPVSTDRVSLADTRVVNRARQSQLQVRPMMTDAERNAFDVRLTYLDQLREDGYQDRFNQPLPQENIDKAKIAALATIKAENLDLDFPQAGAKFIAPRQGGPRVQSARVIEEVAALLKTQGAAGWIYREGEKSNPPQGLISEVSIGNSKAPRGMQVLPGDLVVVELDSFAGDTQLAKTRLEWLAGRGAIITIGAADGSNDMRAELSSYLKEELNYQPLAGAMNVFTPLESTSRYQNKQARESSLTETRGVSRRSMVTILSLLDKGIEENGAWVVPNNERLTGIVDMLNLVPTNAFGGFNVPVGPEQVAVVKNHLNGLNTPEGRGLLREQANSYEQDADKRATLDADFNADFDRLLMRLGDNDGTVLPVPGDEFGTGDFIPLTDGQGRVLLYRHGYRAPERFEVIDVMAAMTLPDSLNAQNVAVYPSKKQPTATTHRGIVESVQPRSPYGLSMNLEIDLQLYGQKQILELNGMKYLLTPKPGNITLPDHGFFKNWGVDLIGSAHDMVSKESFDGLIDNHRNAFAYFGINFLPDVAKFFKVSEREARELLHQWALYGPKLTVSEAHEINSGQALTQAALSQIPEFAQENSGLADPSWVARLADQSSIEGQITQAMLVYLMTPNAEPSHVLRSGGFNDDSTDIDAQSRLMPRLFTEVFDLAPLGSPLRKDINRRLNDQLYNPNTDGSGYILHQNFDFQVKNANGEPGMRGFLQFAEAHAASDNPVLNGMAFDETSRTGISQHSMDMVSQAIGAGTVYLRDPVKARRFIEGDGLQRFEKDQVDGGVWRMLTGIDKDDVSAGMVWRADTPMEAERRSLAHSAVVQFRQLLDMSEEAGWTKTQRTEYENARLKIVRALGLRDSQAEVVDFWVRQHLGQPLGTDKNGNTVGRVTGRGAIEVAKDIFANVEAGYIPTIGAEVPLLHVNDLQAIYRANEKTKVWAPRESMDSNTDKATSWTEWVEVSLGTALTSDNLFDPLYLLSLDGLMHTYQNATRSLLDLPISMDMLKSQELLDPTNNRLLVSLNPNQDLLASEQILLETTRAGLDELIGGQRIGGKFASKAAPASEVAKRREVRRQWRKENGVPIPVDVSMKNFRKNGAQFVEVSTTTNALARMMINLRVGTALLNPALYISMGPEQMVRGTLDRAANLITGQSTVGMAAKGASKIGLSVYSPEQLDKLNTLYSELGKRSDFKGMVYRDLMYLRPYEPGIGRIERALEGYAKFGARAQDPTWGMPGKTLGRRYMEAALQSIAATPTLNVMSVDRLIAEMNADPLFLKKHMPAVHQEASNAIAQIRSLKATPLSLALRGIYEPMSESSNAAVNFFGNVVLKLPLLFSAYGMNVLTTITGMQGLSDMSAAMLEGRKKGPNSFIGRMQAAMRGDDFNPETDAEFDMSSVLEGIDLTRSFIRGGLTHTGLFAFGLMAGGLGLSGEDEETRKRRLAAMYQGAGMIYDPRAIENDFRNQDAIFLDWLPFGWDAAFRVTDENAVGGPKSMAQLNWVTRQFLSPVIGMERFFETGDFRQVTWGFQDAVGSFPLINSLMWDDAVSTGTELAKLAQNENKLGDASNLTNTTWFLTNAVGNYERMLFENSFVNQLYVGYDRYDRDPYVLPLRDSDGDLQKDIEGNVRPNDVALESYIDPETGEIRQGYQGRDTASATLHALTENRGTLAFVTSLFTGGPQDSDFIRYNMPEKLRTFDVNMTNKNVAEAFVRAASQGLGGQEHVSLEEITSVLKAQYIAAENWDGYNQVDAEARQIYKEQRTVAAPLSVLDERGVEVLTRDGQWAVLRGLAKGSVQLGDASLTGISISYETRAEIQKEWMKDLTQEGVNLGLDKTKAIQRMKRLWYGPIDDPEVQGLGDILWSDKISYDESITYKQLNTTYVTGPDGLPWATGFERGKWMSAFGLAPFKKSQLSEQSATSQDQRLNTTDMIAGTNLGLRALERVDESSYIPTDREIGKAIEDAIKEAAGTDYEPFKPYASTSGGGGYSSGGYGGGYGSSYGGSSYFSKMYALPGGTTPYGNAMPMINASTPYVRRASIRRERVWSERGRLKQWQ
jgi:hypothetical protein